MPTDDEKLDEHVANNGNNQGKNVQVNFFEADPDNQPPPPPNREPAKLKLAILGNTVLGKTMKAAFNHRSNVIDVFDDVDALIRWQPHVSMICLDAEFRANDEPDDAQIIDACKKIAQKTSSGICLKTTVPLSTIDRVIHSVSDQVRKKRLVYSPELSEKNDVESMLRNKVRLLGGTEEASKSLARIYQNFSYVADSSFIQAGIYDIAYAKMAIVTYKALQQTFVNQVHETVSETKGIMYPTVMSIFKKVEENIDTVPTFIKAQATDENVSYKKAKSYSGEYLNNDIRAYISETDKLPILEYCYNIKNLEE